MPELKRNILNIGYRINFKCEAMLSHSFDRFYVVTKLILPTTEDIKFLPITFDMHCSYLNVNLNQNKYPAQHLPNIRNFCLKIVPFVYYYEKQIESYNKTIYNILTKEIPLILLNFQKNKKEKRGIITSLVTGLIDWHRKGYLAIYIIKGKKHYIEHSLLWKKGS